MDETLQKNNATKDVRVSVGDNIISLRASLETRLDDVLKIIEINDNVIKIAQNDLQYIKTLLQQLQKGGGISTKIDDKIKLLSKLSGNPQIVSQKSIIAEQVIVLLIGALESYLSDVIKVVGNEQPSLFRFSNENEKISFSHSMLRDGFTLGDAILEHILNKKFSFQDLKSSLEVFDQYLAIPIELSADQKDILILIAASRHIIVHNSSKVDRRFLNQIRDTQFAKAFKHGENIKVDSAMILSSKKAIEGYADEITSAILGKEQEVS